MSQGDVKQGDVKQGYARQGNVKPGRVSQNTPAGPAALATLAALLAAGCSLQPVYERPAAPVAATFPEGAAYGAPAAGAAVPSLSASSSSSSSPSQLALPPAADMGWRDFLADPRLQQLVETALQNNRDLRVAMLRVAQLQAQYRIQRAALFPQLAGDARASNSRSPAGGAGIGGPVSHTESVGISASWEIDFFGRLQSLKDAALEQYLATGYARQAAEILLVSQVVDQYLAWLASGEQLVVTQSTLKSAQASYQLVQLQFDTGTASELNLRLAQTVVEQAQANEAAQVRGLAQADNALVLLLGQPLPPNPQPPVQLADQAILADVPAGLPSDLLTRRPDILQAEAVLRAYNANIGAARAAFFPRIALTGSFGTASSRLGGLFSAGSSFWSFVPALTVPIFDGGANRANLESANLQRDIGVAQYEKAIQIAFREVSDGLAARGTYGSQLAALERYTAAQQRRFELADTRYKNGVDNYLNVLTAQTDFYAAQQALISARLNRLTNLVDLYRALGGGWIARTGDAPRPVDPAIAQ